jgi:hypothetical protein
MSEIFYSEVDINLQAELNARGRAGRDDRSNKAISYMTEKVANVQLTAYAEGSKRDKTKEVHTLGGKTVLTGEYLPGGKYGYLTERPYTLQDSRWAAVYDADSFSAIDPISYQANIKVEHQLTSGSYTNDSYRIPPHITSADFQINDSSKGTTNKATINILIPNVERDLNFMESIYARPGRYCLLEIEHPDSAIMTQPFLSEDALPSRAILKQQFPEAEAEFDRLRRMNAVQFEGVITSFEYAYQADGTIAMTIYLLGTSMVYTDLSLIMQTAAETGSTATGSADIEVDKATAFFKYIADIVYNVKVESGDTAGPKRKLLIDGQSPAVEKNPNDNAWYAWGKCGDGTYRDYINVNALMNAVSNKILSKLAGSSTVFPPAIYSDEYWNVFSNNLKFLCSSNPAQVWIPKVQDTESDVRSIDDPDCYGAFENSNGDPIGISWIKQSPGGFKMNADEQNNYIKYVNKLALSEKTIKQMGSYVDLGRPGCIMINLVTIEEIIKELAGDKDKFTVRDFLEKISGLIFSATGGGINLKLVTDPEQVDILYFRDINWIGSPDSITQKQPYEVPMFQNHPFGTIVRDFKFSAKLPSNVQSLMYTLNSTQNVSEEQIAPYVRFMYNNAAVSRNGETETSTYGSKEIVEKLATEYAALHSKYVNNLFTARKEFGQNFTSADKRSALADALVKYIQYPTPSIDDSSTSGVAPVFPFDVEFTIDGINGLRYGDILDFPGLPSKYQTQTTFTVIGLSHTVSNGGEWTTRVRCIMRPKF